MKKPVARKLQLRADTVRSLSAAQLDNVEGARIYSGQTFVCTDDGCLQIDPGDVFYPGARPR